MRISRASPVLAVHDLEGSGAWYRDVLGCEVEEVEPGNRTREISLRTPDGHSFMLGRRL